MPALLNDAQIDDYLRGQPHWSREGDTLVRTVEAPSFPAAIRIVDAVAVHAEALDHHPDVDIRWRTLHFSLTTHSAGGLTSLDEDLARCVEEAIEAHCAPGEPADTGA